MIFGIVFLFGLVIGSFLNVCIVRMPQEVSVVRPASRCPRCGTPLRWYDNVPIVSFLLLRGKCRTCRLPISWRYPLVELLNGLLAVLSIAVFGLNAEGLIVAFLCSCLLVITFIDLDHQIIPDVITIPGMVIGLALAPLYMTALDVPVPLGLAPDAPPYVAALVNSAIGLLLGGGPLWLIGFAWEKLRKVEAMGGGDVKLMAMMGSFFGWKNALLTIMLGAFAGSIVGITLMALKRHQAEQKIPFGPFLAAGALLALFLGDDILSWYFGILLP